MGAVEEHSERGASPRTGNPVEVLNPQLTQSLLAGRVGFFPSQANAFEDRKGEPGIAGQWTVCGINQSEPLGGEVGLTSERIFQMVPERPPGHRKKSETPSRQVLGLRILFQTRQAIDGSLWCCDSPSAAGRSDRDGSLEEAGDLLRAGRGFKSQALRRVPEHEFGERFPGEPGVVPVLV